MHPLTLTVFQEICACNVLFPSSPSRRWAGSLAGKPIPWNAKFLIERGNCLRLEIVYTHFASPKLKMTVVSPDARTVYRRDTGSASPCANCALVKIDPAPESGFYSVIVSSTNGAVVDTDFHLLFGQYNHSNVSCAAPTTPIP